MRQIGRKSGIKSNTRGIVWVLVIASALSSFSEVIAGRRGRMHGMAAIRICVDGPSNGLYAILAAQLWR